MVKQVVLSVAVSVALATCYAGERSQFEFTGVIRGRDTGTVVLQYYNSSDKLINDTAIVRGGRFSFKGSISEPTLASLIGKITSISVDDPNRKLIFLEPGTMSADLLEGDFQHAAISGSRAQEELEQFNKKIQPLRDVIFSIREATVNASPSRKLTREERFQYDSLLGEISHIRYGFIATHPNSFVNLFLMNYYRNDGIKNDSAKKLYNGLSSEVRNSNWGMQLQKEIAVREDESGMPAPAFTRKDCTGNRISLSSYKGKSYVLLDFWASWCSPCRALSPKLKQLYSKYHSRGFEIISISRDTDPGAWRRAMAKDGTGIWKNIGKELNEEAKAAEMDRNYGIDALPTLILIDKEGKIMGRYAGGESGTMEELEERLKGVFFMGRG